MKIFKQLIGSAVFASAVALAPVSASAAPIELALVVDASGSISNSEWNLQMQGYANALSAVLPTDGSVGVSVIRFGYSASVVQSMMTVSSAADVTYLSNFFTNLSRNGNGGSTCIACGIYQAETTFSGNAQRAIIDVSTDGGYNVGYDPSGPAGNYSAGAEWATAAWAVDNGNATVLNAIGIGTSSAPNFAYGPDSFSLLAADFNDFEAVLTRKLKRELQVPEPATLGLLGMGMMGLFLRRRKMAA